jgi:hypothetical protein
MKLGITSSGFRCLTCQKEFVDDAAFYVHKSVKLDKEAKA